MTPPVGAISPLSLNPLTRDLWPSYDAAMIAQLAEFVNDPCYTIKFYKAPSSQQELMAANAYAAYGLKITPGSIVFGFYLPMIPNTAGHPSQSAPGQFTVQITDVSLNHQWFDAPLASLFLSNYKPTQQSNAFSGAGSFPNLLTSPYPVVGNGLFMVEIQESSGVQQRIELVLGVLEVCSAL
jgi:hypothetical protein